MAKERIIRTSNLGGPLKFLTAPADQGQIVEVSYADTYDGHVICCTYDRSDRTTSYYIAKLSKKDMDDPSPSGLNREPCITGKWKPITLIYDGEDE